MWIGFLTILVFIAMALMGYLGRDISQITKPPDLLFSYSPDYVDSFLTIIGTNGRLAYQASAMVDLVYMFIYTALLIIVSFKIFKPIFKNKKYVIILSAFPVVILLFDLVETGGMLISTFSYPSIPKGLDVIIATATTFKWSLVIMLLTFWLVAIIVKRVFIRNKNTI